MYTFLRRSISTYIQTNITVSECYQNFLLWANSTSKSTTVFNLTLGIFARLRDVQKHHRHALICNCIVKVLLLN